MKLLVFKPGISQNDHLIKVAIIVNERVPIYIDFKKNVPPVGFANLSKGDNGCIWAEIDPSNKFSGFYPYIGGKYCDNQSIEITELGIGASRNTDVNIKQIS